MSAAGPLLASSLTTDARAISLVSVAAGLPWVLFALHSGALADRWDRRRLMWITDAFSAVLYLVFALLVIAGLRSISVLCLVTFLAVSARTLFDSGEQAALPAIVPAKLLTRANSYLFTASILAGLFIGPPLGSVLFSISPAVAFAFYGLCLVVSGLIILRMRSWQPPESSVSRDPVLREIVVGVRWLWCHAQLRALVFLLVVWNLVETSYVAVLVIYGPERIGVAASFYGVLLASVAAGGCLGAGCSPWLVRHWGAGLSVAVAVALSIIATGVLAITRSPGTALVALAAIGFSAFSVNVIASSYRQAAVPDNLRGRVSSAYRFATWGIAPMGAALGGLVAYIAGVAAVFGLGAVVLAVGAAITLPALTNKRLAQSGTVIA